MPRKSRISFFIHEGFDKGKDSKEKNKKEILFGFSAVDEFHHIDDHEEDDELRTKGFQSREDTQQLDARKEAITMYADKACLLE